MPVEIKVLMVSNTPELTINFYIINCMLTNSFVSRDFEQRTNGEISKDFGDIKSEIYLNYSKVYSYVGQSTLISRRTRSLTGEKQSRLNSNQR